VVVNFDPQYVPLHQGASAQIKAKTLVEETFVNFRDGSGPPIADGASLPNRAVKPPVTVDNVLRTLDQPHREALSSTLRSLGAGTQDTHQDLAGAMQGIGDLSRDGKTALDALSEQSASLQQISGNTANVLDALDTREGQIQQLVGDANLVTQSTANNSQNVRAVMRELPGVLDNGKSASRSLTQLSGRLQPVADNVNRSAPSLNAALTQLPQTTRDLRGLLPPLDHTLGKAPNTLQRVGPVAGDLTQLMPNANQALANLNPMLAYLKPYGQDMTTFFTNFGQTIADGDPNGTMLRVMPVIHPQTVKNIPLNINGGPLDNHPYPAPGAQQTPQKDAQPHQPINRSPLKGN
jgi:phospholipid/cholesterol/gamma-HCH transport system substrate-binding protein